MQAETAGQTRLDIAKEEALALIRELPAEEEITILAAGKDVERLALSADREEADYADVIGPDEYHERVTNNAFTNRMAA